MMTPRPDFTMSDMDALISAMQADSGETGEGVTTMELCAALGWSRERVRQRLHDLRAQGRLRLCSRMVVALNGRTQRQTTYAIEAGAAENGG